MKPHLVRRRGPYATAAAALLAASAVSASADDGVQALERGSVELSTAASFSHLSGRGDSGLTVLHIPARIGYFVSGRVELEGELQLSHIDFGDSDLDNGTGVLGSAQVLYHFSPGSAVVPFLLAGGGIGNGEELAGVVLDADRTVTSLTAGAGIKAFAGARAAFRLEYRFRTSWTNDDFRDDRVNAHRVFAGLSIFLK